MQFNTWFQTTQPQVSDKSIAAVLILHESGATVPFMARYRKEVTGNLDEVVIQEILDQKEKWDHLLTRQKSIVTEIESQGKLTDELKSKILNTYHLDELEDLYLPYKKKRKSKAQKAKEAGLEELANWIWGVGHGEVKPEPGQSLLLWSETFKNPQLEYPDGASAIAGAQDILIERLSEDKDLRQVVRSKLFDEGVLKTSKADKAKESSKFDRYFQYEEKISSLLDSKNSHRYLAIRRGWIEEELKLEIGGASGDPAFEQSLISRFENFACTEKGSDVSEVLHKAAKLAYKAHVFPAIEREVHRELKETADKAAIEVFSNNIRKVLLAPLLGPKTVLGVDPGVRTGCKIAVVDSNGKYVSNFVLHLESAKQKEDAKKSLPQVFTAFQVAAIGVGNGTAGRETEGFFRTLVKDLGLHIPVVMVSESGASIYSASDVAREEFPDLDLTVRGAISIARRLQDPLAELVKLDPKSIGVGQYQHDVNPGMLKKSLDQVVESCVNRVGVNLNTASYHLLAYVSGIGRNVAKSIVEYRSKIGGFKSREDLLKVPYFSDKVFEQAAGFLRVPDSNQLLDNTGVHPEKYNVLEKFATQMGKKVSDFIGAGADLLKKSGDLKSELGEFSFKDIIEELQKPGRDPREEFKPTEFREDVHALEDLKPGMICPGLVTNVTNFGAFVDIGVHQDGLVHISELSYEFVKDPKDVVSPGDPVKAIVLAVDLAKRQISLSLKTGARKEAVANAPRVAAGGSGGRFQEQNRNLSDRKGPVVLPIANKPGSAPQQRQHKKPAANSAPFNNPFASLAGKFKK